jgi:O-antigen/teichoic acid export membrane protein
LFNGIYINFLAPIIISKKTGFLFVISFVGAGINVLFNLILIPVLNIYGAAISVLSSYFSMALLSYFISRKLYHVPYEFKRIGRIALLTIVLVGPAVFMEMNAKIWLFYRIFVLLVYPLLLYMEFRRNMERKTL